MIIKKATFYTSVGTIDQLPADKREIAVAGKSNVGKSSFINFMCNHSKLAKTSKEPGRTRLLNYFDINDGEFSFVDLPGYGYAKVSREEKLKWAALIEEYFRKSDNLLNVFLLLDIRFKPTEDDMTMIKYMYCYNIPFTIIATKMDKLSRSAAFLRRSELAEYIGIGKDNIYMVSSLNKQGKEQILERIESILSAHTGAIPEE